jgi:hypothetical protein
MKTPISHLTDLYACRDAVEWVKSTKCRSLESAWLKCARADWMLWYAGKKAGPVGSESRLKLVLIACECAELVLPIFEKAYPKDDRPRKAIEAARAYALNPSKETAYAANAAYASNAAAFAAAKAAAKAAAYAAYAAYAAAKAANAAVKAAYAADAAYAAYAADKKDIQAKCVAIVRKHFPALPTKEKTKRHHPQHPARRRRSSGARAGWAKRRANPQMKGTP